MSAFDDVVITGVGVCSPLGHTSSDLLSALAQGDSALAPIDAFDASPFPCSVGAQVTDFKARDWVSNRKNLKLMSRAVRYGLAAMKRAWAQAGLADARLDPERVGMFVGAGTAMGESRDLLPALERGFVDERFDLPTFARDGVSRISPLWLLKGLSNNALGFGSADLDARGVNQNYCNSAAGGLQAVGEAAWSVVEGLADVVVAGGADSALDPAHLTGFSRLDMLTSRSGADAVRPFDASHDGFAPGEGAAFFILERRSHAAARGAAVLGQIAGYGTSSAAHLLPKGDPAAIVQAGGRALELAGWSPSAVDLVYAHGNATPAFDCQEAAGLAQLFGPHRPVVTTNKGQLGHTIAASGPLSAACALEAGRQGVRPGVPSLRQLASGCEGLNVTAAPRTGRATRSLVHAAGIGGQVSVLALEATP